MVRGPEFEYSWNQDYFLFYFWKSFLNQVPQSKWVTKLNGSWKITNCKSSQSIYTKKFITLTGWSFELDLTVTGANFLEGVIRSKICRHNFWRLSRLCCCCRLSNHLPLLTNDRLSLRDSNLRCYIKMSTDLSQAPNHRLILILLLSSRLTWTTTDQAPTFEIKCC